MLFAEKARRCSSPLTSCAPTASWRGGPWASEPLGLDERHERHEGLSCKPEDAPQGQINIEEWTGPDLSDAWQGLVCLRPALINQKRCVQRENKRSLSKTSTEEYNDLAMSKQPQPNCLRHAAASIRGKDQELMLHAIKESPWRHLSTTCPHQSREVNGLDVSGIGSLQSTWRCLYATQRPSGKRPEPTSKCWGMLPCTVTRQNTSE